MQAGREKIPGNIIAQDRRTECPEALGSGRAPRLRRRELVFHGPHRREPLPQAPLPRKAHHERPIARVGERQLTDRHLASIPHVVGEFTGDENGRLWDLSPIHGARPNPSGPPGVGPK